MSSNSHQTRERLTAMALQLLDELLLRLTGRFQPGNGRVQLGLAAPLVDAWGFQPPTAEEFIKKKWNNKC